MQDKNAMHNRLMDHIRAAKAFYVHTVRHPKVAPVLRAVYFCCLVTHSPLLQSYIKVSSTTATLS